MIMYEKKVHFIALNDQGQGSRYLCGIYGDYLETDIMHEVTCNTCRRRLNMPMPKLPIPAKDSLMKNKEIFDNTLWLSTRILNVFYQYNIETVADLEKLTYRELLKMKNLGRKSYMEIVEEMRKHGLYLFGEKPGTPEHIEATTEHSVPTMAKESASIQSLFQSIEVTLSIIKNRLLHLISIVQDSQDIIKINQENKEKAIKYDELMKIINK